MLGQGVWVATRAFLCHDRVLPRVGFSIATELATWEVFSVVIENSAAHDMPGYAHKHAHQRWCCSRAQHVTGATTRTTKLSSSSLHCVVHCLSYCSLALFMGTIHGRCSYGFPKFGFKTNGTRKKKNDPRDLRRHSLV